MTIKSKERPGTKCEYIITCFVMYLKRPSGDRCKFIFFLFKLFNDTIIVHNVERIIPYIKEGRQSAVVTVYL